MMKMGDMKSMKNPKPEKKKSGEKGYPMTVESDHQEYPYGLKIRLEEDQVKKLEKAFNLDVDEPVMVSAKGYVCYKSSNDRSGGKSDRTMEIQITDMSCESMKKKPDEDPFLTK